MPDTNKNPKTKMPNIQRRLYFWVIGKIKRMVRKRKRKIRIGKLMIEGIAKLIRNKMPKINGNTNLTNG
ncbi:MAG: hypothetical protein A2W98_11765 [Bacteroidetes bacterium GWF2_33_38]|nr:MAG: hypothetical protein A2W98_11765 [Bacteroidetes bacterium GWF2_33_38]OFY76375.1 MAG: hypothetical protein A2265_02050 [Bacteroidetes bacterium RIFOXYA12_FULL_33_9]